MKDIWLITLKDKNNVDVTEPFAFKDKDSALDCILSSIKTLNDNDNIKIKQLSIDKLTNGLDIEVRYVFKDDKVYIKISLKHIEVL